MFQDDRKLKWQKSFFWQRKDVPTFTIQSLKEYVYFWLLLIGLFIVIKLGGHLLFGESISIALLAYGGGLLLAVAGRNIVHFASGSLIGWLSEIITDFLGGLL